MSNRKKVIKALECCADKTGKCCYECPYKSECDIDQESVSFDSDPECVSFDMLKDALTLLREQKAVELLAIRKDIVDEVYDWIAECPACGMTWAMWHPDRMRFCPGCGKAVRWNE